MRLLNKILNPLLFGAFVVSAALNVAQHSWTEQEKRVLHDELASLQKQADIVDGDDQAALPAQTGPVTGQSTMRISLYGITLTVFDPVSDLVYGEVKDGSGMAAGFTTQTLLAKYPACKAGALGTLVRVKAPNKPSPSPTPTRSVQPTRTPANQPFSKTVGGYTYSYRKPAFSCANDQAGLNAVAAATATVKSGVLPTLVQTP